MLIAASIPPDGKKVLFLGLQKENIEHLLNDKPIEKNLQEEGVPGLEDWVIYIFGPEDTARFVAHFKPTGEVDED